MKKLSIVGLMIIVLSTPIFASTLDEIVNKTLIQSSAVQSAKNTLTSNQIAVQELLAEDNLSYSISTGDLTYGAYGDDASSSTESDYSVSPSLTINFNDDNDTSLYTSSSLSSSEGTTSGSISTSLESTFDFNKEDTSDELQAKLNLLEANYQYNKALLTVKGQVYSYISSILNYQYDLEEAQNTLDEYQETYDQEIAVGTYIAEDVAAKSQMAKITAQQNIVEIKAQAIDLLKEQFESYSGIEYEDLDEFDEIELTMDMSELNSSIEIAKAQIDVYEEELRLLEEDTNELYAAGGISSDIGDNISASTSATYSFDNYSFSSGLAGTYNYDDEAFYPYVSVSATYTSDSNTTSEKLEILAAENLVQQANLDLQDALSDHSLEVFSLQNDIQESNLELQQFEIEKTVNLESLENIQTLYDNGYATETELTEAKNLCSLDTIEEQIIKLDRLIIQNNIDKEFL